ncbi:hypothetical protein Pmani_039559 [Petrolisthes manimaculis]|uniref:Cullin N-terminal domain-containing protein n=1 Tax=Petrolisthes manimaculis TaxID=1843537 RepID=A0AAE1NC99_9EUCA|nr:hypothetical protein Pmani_039559 [Petrolisthes manimaculis]
MDEIFPQRALALGMMTHEDYSNTFWPKLCTAVDKLLEGPPPQENSGPPIEFEPMYAAAYKCVCQQHSETLYKDLTSHIHTHFHWLATQLQNGGGDNLIDKYYHAVHRAMYSLDGIIPIFTYLNKVYVVSKLSSNLRTELQMIFCTAVIDPVIDKLIATVKEVNGTDMRPFSAAPHVVASLIKNLYKLNPTYAHQYPQVFASYIPCVLPAMREQELSNYISETQQLQASLRQSWLCNPSITQGTKRSLDDEGNT